MPRSFSLSHGMYGPWDSGTSQYVAASCTIQNSTAACARAAAASAVSAGGCARAEISSRFRAASPAVMPGEAHGFSHGRSR
eukprot:CAMPEP_0119338840 /NCGR_PEP_ID=MMETSP1333-20130426/97020_1 /TAXON_ID=418940 /ORGANISM="Scyphosphaera apsteinii, Strain RCC1455" /LENGTH=80 /DNA_ID=CAMNT_0007350245 /DNA_START=482 /DNA_END=724 /DNA_ORIENTATION=+